MKATHQKSNIPKCFDRYIIEHRNRFLIKDLLSFCRIKGEIVKTKQIKQILQVPGQFIAVSLALLSVFLVIDTPDSTHRSPMESLADCHTELGVMKVASNVTAWCEERK
jgi:hypothetical protein